MILCIIFVFGYSSIRLLAGPGSGRRARVRRGLRRVRGRVRLCSSQEVLCGFGLELPLPASQRTPLPSETGPRIKRTPTNPSICEISRITCQRDGEQAEPASPTEGRERPLALEGIAEAVLPMNSNLVSCSIKEEGRGKHDERFRF